MRFLLVAAAALVLMSAPSASAQNSPLRKGEEKGPIELVFTQQASSMKFDGKTLTLEGVAPSTSFYADRPQQTTGYLTTAQFVKLWTASQDSFKNDPPNAALSFVGDKDAEPVVVELMNVSGSGDTLSYSVNVLEGKLPDSAGAVNLVIDPWVWQPASWGNGPFLNCTYSWYWRTRICRGAW
ncbi:hypothetical protein [Segnochrobactrum spirostomi]|uniref:Uncharacterized protein n=1 Tax=Segnochrobactrum spirostomi TaxID=2608987 RepID=A0A6A7Y4P7_9HYPH|nr:hypothetical protein [Segnochrobactrum spirostomi]MQT13716.1 hypothetical protein [Segnochrobactrum spirostomi]